MATASKPVEQDGHEFEPYNQAQKRFMDSTHDEVLYSGAFGAGKSYVGCQKGLLLSRLYPGNVGLICRAKYEDLKSTTLQTLWDEVIPPSLIIQYHKNDKYVDLRTGPNSPPSRIWFRGLDRPKGIGSMNLGWVFVDEAIEATEEQWAMLEGRLRLNRVPFHQIFTATNPDAPAHWLYQRFYQEPKHDPELRDARLVVEADALENPHNPESYRARLNRFQGVFRERYVLGKWVGSEGLVYPMFNPTHHITDSFEIPEDWPRYRCIDFGTNNPFVCKWWAEDPRSGDVYCYREVYMTGRTATDHARTINEHTQHPVQWTVADHDLGDRLDLHKAGIDTVAAVKDVREGIQAMQARLLPKEHDAKPEGLGEMFYFRDRLLEKDPRLEMEGRPVETTDEYGVYKWAEGAHGTVKDEPLKKHDHGLDADRYFVMRLDRYQPGGGGVVDLSGVFNPGGSR